VVIIIVIGGGLMLVVQHYLVVNSGDGVETIEALQEIPQTFNPAESPEPSSPQESESSLSTTYGLPCPVAFPSGCTSMQVHRGANLESWQALSERDCRDVAREVLLELRNEGYELVRADFLDLSGESWGCAVKTVSGESLIVSLIPERLGSPRSENNKLMVTVTHIVEPDLGQEKEQI
jgi:hypothetical protein